MNWLGELTSNLHVWAITWIHPLASLDPARECNLGWRNIETHDLFVEH
jgi:hypothetical protein